MKQLSSKSLYQLINNGLKSFAVTKKFKKNKSTFPSWYFQYNDKFISFWFQAARDGGEFTCEFQISDNPLPGTAKWNQRFRIYNLLNREGIDELKKIKGTLSGREDIWIKANDEDVPYFLNFFIRNFDDILKRFTNQLSTGSNMKKKKNTKKILIILILLTFSFALTILSSKLYVKTYKGVVGNICGPADSPPPNWGWCYEDLPMGGFPFIYLKDDPSTSVISHLSFIIDTIFLDKFFLDWGFYLIICTGTYLLFNKLRKAN